MTSKGSIIQIGFYTLISPKSLIQKQQILKRIRKLQDYSGIRAFRLKNQFNKTGTQQSNSNGKST